MKRNWFHSIWILIACNGSTGINYFVENHILLELAYLRAGGVKRLEGLESGGKFH